MDRIKTSLLLYFFLLAIFAYTIYPKLKENEKAQYYIFASIIFIGFISYFSIYKLSN